MTAISDTYSSEVMVPEAGKLTERELALLALPLGQMPEPQDVPVAEVARERVQEMLDLSVATRQGKVCSKLGCHTPAAFKIVDAAGEETLSCRPDLAFLVDTDSEITLLDGPLPAEPGELQPEPIGEPNG